MKKNRKKILIIFPIIIVVAVFAVKFWAQQQCNEYTGIFTEDFRDDDYKDLQWTSVRNWPPPPITLDWLGANFDVKAPLGMGARIYVIDAGDFDSDGKPDLIGLDITNDPDNRLILIRNFYEDLNNDKVDDDGIVFMIDPTEVYEQGVHLDVGPASIKVADYNNDGLLDFFFYKNDLDEFGYTNFIAAMYINVGTATDPDFYTYNSSPNLDFTSAFMGAGIYCNWAADHLTSVDIDGDGDMDILVISEDKIFLVRNPGPGNFALSNFTITELNYDLPTGFTLGRGGSSVDAGDFDKDGDIDVIGGTVNDIPYLVYYENDGTGYFTRKELPIPMPECTGTVGTCVGDFTGDGLLDIFAGTDLWNKPDGVPPGPEDEARMWLMKNAGVVDKGNGPEMDFTFRCLNSCLPILPPPHDVDMSAMLDYDGDGDLDVILADANHSGDYYLIRNDLADVFALTGEARSTDVAGGLDQKQYAVTRVKLRSIRQKVLGGSSQGLSVELYVSNNGRDWELYTRFDGVDIHNASDLHWHTFNHFGSHLYWKALLFAEEDVMAEYEGASFESPAISDLKWEFVYVDRREYSRTSVVVTSVTDNSQKKELVIAATFYFPGWQGHLRAYDVTNMTPDASSDSILRTVTRSDLSSASGRDIAAAGVNILWDAGELLDNRSPGSRQIYTAVPDGASGMSRLDFTAANVATLGPILQDVNNDNVGLIDFVRGEGRYWKLGDMNHSNPVAVGPPDGEALVMGSGYDSFMVTNQNRRKVVYLGANDGILHCFDALTGEELWGYIPYNLLPKLKNMWAVDAATGERYFSRDVYVDGSPVAADVYINADGIGGKEWRTVLICGQGPGRGSMVAGGINYYFALDVTDPYDPQPRWELTDITMGETWSVPVVGKAVVDTQDTYVAFMGSGYDNDNTNVVGNYFYAVDVESGNIFWKYGTTDVNTSASFPNIPNTIPGSPSLIDIDQNGFADRVYFADLDGRVYRLDTSTELDVKKASWDNTLEVIYEDANNYPIISRPEPWADSIAWGVIPKVYFGTGGDDRAPSTTTYSFIALTDDVSPEVEWYMGDPAQLNLDPAKDMGDLGIGEKVWADPVVANSIVYFNTLTGSIESVDPCANLIGLGKLYGRFVQAVGGSALGGSAFKGAAGTLPSLDLASKTRSAVTLGDVERVGTTRKRDVYIQEYDSTIQKLEQPVPAVLKVKSWREIYKIVRF
ncbi:MAG: PilC/PilY family type IV pilus protein [Candidatus Aminicenantes bacterium]|nr:PilC/PilY family type IV pilus protein [Candidatus Aminicenantes bacterium]